MVVVSLSSPMCIYLRVLFKYFFSLQVYCTCGSWVFAYGLCSILTSPTYLSCSWSCLQFILFLVPPMLAMRVLRTQSQVSSLSLLQVYLGCSRVGSRLSIIGPSIFTLVLCRLQPGIFLVIVAIICVLCAVAGRGPSLIQYPTVFTFSQSYVTWRWGSFQYILTSRTFLYILCCSQGGCYLSISSLYSYVAQGWVIFLWFILLMSPTYAGCSQGTWSYVFTVVYVLFLVPPMCPVGGGDPLTPRTERYRVSSLLAGVSPQFSVILVASSTSYSIFIGIFMICPDLS